MQGIDAKELAGRLSREKENHWIHIESSSRLEKYPGE
jgi:hypothetical protein